MKTSTMAALVLWTAVAIPGVGRGQAAAGNAGGDAVLPKVDFTSVDKNTDGRLARDETLGIKDLHDQFQKLDADGDAHLSPTEFMQWSRAGRTSGDKPREPATVPRGSAGSQHMPEK